MNKTTTRTNGNGHKTRKLVKATPNTSAESLMVALLRAADDVYAAQGKCDAIRVEFEGHVAAISVRAISEPLFDGKAEGEKRPASNDKERALAIELTLHLDPTYVDLRVGLENAERDLALTKARQINLRLAAQLLLRG
jgi:hypothetical protein